MDISQFLSDNEQLIKSVIVVIFGIIIYRVLRHLNKKTLTRRSGESRNSRRLSVINSIFNLVKFAITICVVLVILNIYGVDVSSFLVGVGVFSAVAGLAFQDLLKDVIRGMNILTDNYFGIGDVVKFNEFTGKVIDFDLRCTKIRDIKTGDILTLSNSSIEQIVKLSDLIFINVPTCYEDKVEKILPVLDEIMSRLKESELIEECGYENINELGDSSVQHFLRIKIKKPEYRFKARRLALRTIKEVFDSKNITIPFPQIDVHNK